MIPVFQKKINLLHEAALLIQSRKEDTVQRLAEHAGNFGMSAEEMRALLRSYSRFEEGVRPGMEIILREQPEVLSYFDVSMLAPEAEPSGTIPLWLSMLGPDTDWLALTQAQTDVLVRKLLNTALSAKLGRDLEPGEESRIVSILYGLPDFSDTQKLLLIRFVTERYSAVGQIYSVLSQVAALVEANMRWVKEEVDALFRTLTKAPDTYRKIRQLLPVQATASHEIQVSISVAGFNGIIIFGSDDHFSMYIGLHALILLERHDLHNEDAIDDLKALAEQTRWRILRLLSREPLYLHELAERLSLTPATVSHHLDILTAARLTICRVEGERGRRVQYTTSSKQLRFIAGRLEKLAKEAEYVEAET